MANVGTSTRIAEFGQIEIRVFVADIINERAFQTRLRERLGINNLILRDGCKRKYIFF